MIDIGNTFAKVGVFQNDQLIKKYSFGDWNFSIFANLADNHLADNIIISNVNREAHYDWRQVFDSRSVILELIHNTPLPITNNYETPETLGRDRIAGVVGAWKLYPHKNTVVIDAGTCITYDIISDKGQFIGGNISPGLMMRFKAMHKFTASLPLVELNEQLGRFGVNTKTALQVGGQFGVIFEIEGFIDLYGQLYKELNVILTGGDAEFLAKKLKKEIFVNQNLVLVGLNEILNYNLYYF